MNKKNKSSKIIIDEKEILQKTKEFLENAGANTRGVKLQLEEESEKRESAVAYEKENFIIVLPNGEVSSARLYGNWDEALSFAQRILTKGQEQKNSRIVLAEYERDDML
jgi:hypothetical protein